MKGLSFIRGAAVALATIGIVIPQGSAVAAGPKTSVKPAVKVVAANTILDIGLTKGGTFTGRIVDHTGSALEGAEVVVKQGQTEVTRTITDKQGTFTAKNLKGGVYTVSSGATEGTYRTWAENTAPPAAKEQALLVMGENGTRGQMGAFDGSGLLLVGVGGIAIAALVVGIIALDKANDNPSSP